jgi:nickel superoxide dismutase
MILPAISQSHCQIPCGIYDDAMRFDMLAEHITTIEKSMNEINRLSAEGDKNYNQLVRWIVNKEDHANQFIEIVNQYFMAQRIKPVMPDDAEKYKDYQKSLELTHQMIVTAMKCKQTADLDNTKKLSELLEQYRAHYFKDHGHEH